MKAMLEADDPFVALPRDLRWYRLTIFNRGRAQRGTASAYRWLWALRSAKARHPSAVLSPRGKEPVLVRSRVAGPVVLICESLEQRQ
jgi:hypothetical protein